MLSLAHTLIVLLAVRLVVVVASSFEEKGFLGEAGDVGVVG